MSSKIFRFEFKKPLINYTTSFVVLSRTFPLMKRLHDAYVLKNGGQRAFIASIFNMKGSNLERPILKFAHKISPILYSVTVYFTNDNYTMDWMNNTRRTFRNIPYARYATGFSLQQAYRPSGIVPEVNKYFGRKHKLYGYKVEASVSPSRLAIHATVHYAESVSDLTILQKERYFHEVSTDKRNQT